MLQVPLQRPGGPVPVRWPAVSRLFRHRLRVRYAECDSQGVVFNAHYVMYFDTVMTELWREAVGSYAAMVEGGTDLVVAAVGVRYLSPARFDDELEFRTAVTRLGTTAMSTRIAVSRLGDGGPVAEGELHHVFVEAGTSAKKPIPGEVRRGLEPYVGAPIEEPD
jgi:acyl-CoA thioester hydrolase